MKELFQVPELEIVKFAVDGVNNTSEPGIEPSIELGENEGDIDWG